LIRYESETAGQTREKTEALPRKSQKDKVGPEVHEQGVFGPIWCEGSVSGKKSINLRVEKSQAFLLGIALMNALLKGGETLDIAIYDFRRQEKAGKIPAGTHPSTVTFAVRR